MENLEEIKADHNPNLKLEGIIVNQFLPRAALPLKLVTEMLEEGLPLLQPYLSSSVKIKESHELSKPMIYLDPTHKLSQQFSELHQTLENLQQNAALDTGRKTA